jgi:hypothetical protein
VPAGITPIGWGARYTTKHSLFILNALLKQSYFATRAIDIQIEKQWNEVKVIF